MAECTDLGENPLFDNKIVSIWEEERKHVWCLQDPERVALYTVTGHITNAGWSCQCSVVQEVLPHWNHSNCNRQVCNILWSFSNCYNPTSSLLDSSWILRQAICTITLGIFAGGPVYTESGLYTGSGPVTR